MCTKHGLFVFAMRHRWLLQGTAVASRGSIVDAYERDGSGCYGGKQRSFQASPEGSVKCLAGLKVFRDAGRERQTAATRTPQAFSLGS